MKKSLLIFAGAAAISFGAYAQSVNLNVDDATDIQGTFTEETYKDDGSVQAAAHYQPLISFTLDGYTFEFSTTNDNASSQPAYYYATSTNANQQKTVRIYNGTTMTITAPADVTMSKIEFTGSNLGNNAAFTVNTGSWTTNNNAVWAGSANSISVTANASWRFSALKITTGEGGGNTETPDVPVVPADVYTVAQALAVIASGNIPAEAVQVKGIISAIDEISTSYGNATYDIVDEGSTDALKVFRGYWLGGEKFTSENQLEVGAVVVVEGKLQDYNGTPEVNSGNKIISYNGKTSDEGGNQGGGETPSTPGEDGTLAANLNVNDAADIQGTFIEETYKEDGSVQAATHYQPLESFFLGDYTFEFSTTNDNASSQPAYYYATSTSANQQKTVRIYNGTTMKITAPEGVEMTKIEFTGSNLGSGASFTVNTGSWTTDNNAVWVGSANSVSVTANASWRFSALKVYTGGTGGGETPTPETYLFEKATAIESGSDYVLLVGDQLGTALSSTVSYGRLNLATATFSGDKVETTAANAITITEGDDGYTMKDALGRYLGMDAAHKTSFQLYTDLTEGCYWIAEFEADGTVCFTNNLTEAVISQTKGANDTWYTNIAPAVLEGDVEYNLPTLYKKSGSGVESVSVADENAPVEYFNLQGVRIANPENGLYIRRQGSSVSKVLVK